MINRVFKLKKAAKLPNGVSLPEGQELEVVTDVVYMGGHPIPFEMQATMLKWIKENPTLFTDVTKNW
jgi:hypothetical protein